MSFRWDDFIRDLYSYEFDRAFHADSDDVEPERPRGAFFPKQDPRPGFIDARESLRGVPIITSLGGIEDRQEQALVAELEHYRG